jgi:hypothetical protein
LPHSEPLSSYRHKSDLPEQETEREAQDRECLGSIEPIGICPNVTQ